MQTWDGGVPKAPPLNLINHLNLNLINLNHTPIVLRHTGML